jgi:transcription antitermination factor NusG
MLDTSQWKKGDVVGYVEIIKPRPIVTEGQQLRWHIVITEPGRERRALENIADLGLQAYWPRLHHKIPAGRRRSREIEVSMFPSRVLVPMPGTNEAWHRVKCSPGVRDFMMQPTEARGHVARASYQEDPKIEKAIGAGFRLATLPDFAVDAIRKIEARKNAKYRSELVKREENPYQKGRKVWVEIMLGKMLATIDDLDGQGRINVLTEVEIFGRKVWPFKPHELQLIEE